MRHAWKRSIGILAVVGGLAVGTAGVASAQADEPSATAEASTRGHQVRRGAVRLAFETAVTTIGIEAPALKDAVKGGQTIGQVADAHGVPAQTVVDAIVAALEGRVDEALAAGKIDAERATNVKERIPGAADRFVNTLPRRVQSRSAG